MNKVYIVSFLITIIAVITYGLLINSFKKNKNASSEVMLKLNTRALVYSLTCGVATLYLIYLGVVYKNVYSLLCAIFTFAISAGPTYSYVKIFEKRIKNLNNKDKDDTKNS